MNTWLRQDLNAINRPLSSIIWFGTFASDITGIGDFARVILPEFDDVLVWDNCRGWAARPDGTMPQKGDECIIAFDNRNQPWVIAWNPYV